VDQESLGSVLFAWRRFVCAVTAVAAVVSVVVSLLLPRWYEATATCMPPEKGSPGGSLMMGLLDQFGGGMASRSLLSRTPETDIALGVLKSRSVRAKVVDRFDLTEVYGSRTPQHATEKLGKHITVRTTAEGMLEVRVEDRDGQRAADMANLFLELLDQHNRRASVEDARRTREFVEGCLAESRTRLEAASSGLRAFQEEHGAIALAEQTRVTVEAIAELQAQQAQLEITRGVLSDHALPGEMRVEEVDARLREVARQRNALEGTGAQDHGASGALLPLSGIPAIGARFADLTREAMVREKVYAFLTTQLEEARIQEARDLRTVDILDEAIPPVKRARPRRSLIVVLTCVLALLGTMGVALVTETARTQLAGGPMEDLLPVKALLSFRSWAVGGAGDPPSGSPQS
jgi:uncharacterized protein involved in exopolysaccharide biosynthesis